MTTQKEIYNTLDEAKQAKDRNRTTHKLDEPKHTNKLTDGRYEIIWVLPDDPQHSKNQPVPQKRQLTQAQFIQELANERGVELT